LWAARFPQIPFSSASLGNFAATSGISGAELDEMTLREVSRLLQSPAAPDSPDGPWSKPNSPVRWAKLFGVTAKTFKRHVAEGKIRAKILSDRLYQIHVADVPRVK
jgi:hypothetical protein